MSGRVIQLKPPKLPDCFAVLDKEEANRQVYQALANGSKLIVNVSGGKDGLATLLIARYEMGLSPQQLIVHHQLLPEAWPGTLEYIEAICRQLGVTFWFDQCDYGGYECGNCGFHYTSSRVDQTICPECKSNTGVELTRLRGVLDLVAHRRKWPDSKVRFCTDYTKIRVFNSRLKQELATIGPTPVTVLGERWRESAQRQQLPWLRERPKFNTQQVRLLEYRPILDYRRIEAFRKLRQYGITPHYAYFAQGMTEHQMFELDEESGPRCSCVMCIFAQPEHVRRAYELPLVKSLVERAVQIEAESGHRWKARQSLAEVIQPRKLANLTAEDFL